MKKIKKDLRKKYFDFINEICPYWELYEEIPKNIALSSILYNLIEMRKDWGWEDEPETLKKCTDLINELVKTGVKSANIGG